MFSNSNLTIRFLVGGVVASLLLLLAIGGGTGFAGVAFLLTSLHHWYVNPERNASFILIPIGFTSILIGLALLVATTAVYFFGRNRMRTASEGFPSAPGQG